MKLYDSELKVLETLWTSGDMTAKRIAEILKEQIGWSKTTTYTVIKKCVAKNLIGRTEPNFLCKAIITKQEAREMETTELINRVYGGMTDELVASLLWRKDLSQEDIEKLKKLVLSLDNSAER